MAKKTHHIGMFQLKYLYYLVVCFFLGKYINNLEYKRNKKHKGDYLKVGCVAGSLLMIDSKWFIENGGYDENIFLYMEEACLGKKAEIQNKNTYICRKYNYLHQHGYTISKFNSLIKKRKILLKSIKTYLKKFYKIGYIYIGILNILYSIGTIELFALSELKRLLKGKKNEKK